MPKRGKKNPAEVERESDPKFVALRHQHSAVESEINSLEHHGLNRCLDVGLPGYLRYVGFGVMSYNLHVIGRKLLARQLAWAKPVRWGGLKPPNLKPRAKSEEAVSLPPESF